MAEPRPFPPSPRRLALARASGLTSVSPLLVGAAAMVAVVGVVFTLGAAAAAQLGRWIASACAGADGATHVGAGAAKGAAHVGATAAASAAHVGATTADAAASAAHVGATTADAAASAAHVGATTADAAASAAHVGATTADAAETAAHVGATAAASTADMDATTSIAATALPLARVASAVLELALPLIAAAAIAALIVHVAQTRGLWLPRRSLPGAPRLPRSEVARSALDLAGAVVIGAVCLGWLWTTAPQLALLVESPGGAGAALASLLAALAIAWVGLGVVDALVRHVQLTSALAMTRDEKREDDRLAAADPRWRAQRLSVMRGNTSDAVARAAIVLLGEDTAVAVAWDAVRQPVPLRTATGRRARATQLVALARRHRIAVHRDSDLAARLVDHEGPVPESDWPRLAELIAAVRR